MSVKMGSVQSFVRFVTPELEKWSEQNTVEFWFKLQNKDSYNNDGVLFSMTDSGGTFDYYQIYIQNGDLVCAPFGSKDPKDPVLVFDSFKKRN